MMVSLMSFANAIIITDWKTIDPLTGEYTNQQMYDLTGQLADYPEPYGLMPMVINDVEVGQEIIFDIKVWKKNTESSENIYISAVVSENGGALQNLPLEVVGGERVIYAQAQFQWYRINYTVPANIKTISMRFDSSFHLDSLEETEKVYMYFQTPLQIPPLTAMVVNDNYQVFDEVVIMNIFDYNEYSHEENRVLIIDKKAPENFVETIQRTHNNVLDFGSKTNMGTILFTSVFYAIIVMSIFSISYLVRRIRLDRPKLFQK